MEQYSVRNTYQYQLMPTPQHEQALETVLSRCRTLYNCALEQRTTCTERLELRFLLVARERDTALFPQRDALLRAQL